MKLLLTIVFGVLLSIHLSAKNSQNHSWRDYNKNGTMDVYEDANAPIDQRLENLLAQMTLEEKICQFRSWTYLNVETWNPNELSLGLIGHIAHNTAAAEATRRINLAQQKQIDSTRLGIPILFFEEALHGLKTVKATSFPQAICLASTWNIELMSAVSKAIALETKSRGIRQVLSPVVDLGRDPRWGRTQETYGEDPFLASKMAVAFCKSFEDSGIVTTPKHFVANWGDGGRDSWAMYLSERYLNEVYFQPYKACIEKAGSRSMMPAYHTLDGIPCSMNYWLLTEKARNEWGFKGFYGSDFSAVRLAMELHKITDDPAELAALALNAGLDVEWPKALYYGKPLEDALEKGLISESLIHQTAKRILRVKFEIGLFEHPFGDIDLATRTNDSQDHRALALEAAQQGIILLKNDENVLPFDAHHIDTLLVVGKDAEDVNLGNYSGTGMKTVSFLEALQREYPEIQVLHHPGVESSPTRFMLLPGQIFGAMDTSGMQIQIFNNRNFKGTPLVDTLLQKSFYFRSHGGTWGAPAPGELWPGKSMRIRGTFVPEKSFTATLQIEASGSLHLSVNNIEILNNRGTLGKKDGFFDDAVGQIGVMSDLGNPSYHVEYHFVKDQTYHIQFNYVHDDMPRLQMSASWDQAYGLEDELNELNRMAQSADHIIVFPDGIIEGEFKDRSTIRYPAAEETMITQLASEGKPTIVVMVNGAAMAMPWATDIPAIIEQWYAGEESGSALADIIFGKVNPSGKLPVTFPQTDGQLPLNYDYRPVGRSTGFQDPLAGKPAYPFGHGLSYTQFSYDNITLSDTLVRKGDTLKVTVEVKNTGKRAGFEIVQLYLHDEYASVARPLKELKAFSKVYLHPGDTKRVELKLTQEEFSIWDKNMHFTLEPGYVTLWVGASSEDIRLEERVRIVGDN